MSFPRLPADSQGMRLRRPFTWLVLFGMGCSLTGLYRVLDGAPAVQAVSPAPRTSATVAASVVAANASPTTVTEAPPVGIGPATAAVAAAVATPAPSPAQGLVGEAPAVVATQAPEVLPTHLAVSVAPGIAAPAKAAQLIDLMNSARINGGVAALKRDAALDDVALARARSLVQNRYFDHYAPDGESAFSELAARGIRYRLAGENLARNNYAEANTVEAAFEGLMASAGHRANILEERFSKVGVAAVQSGKMWVYVSVFKD